MAAAAILPKDCDILYINDSKKLTAAKRDELYDVIMEKAVSVGIAVSYTHLDVYKRQAQRQSSIP